MLKRRFVLPYSGAILLQLSAHPRRTVGVVNWLLVSPLFVCLPVCYLCCEPDTTWCSVFCRCKLCIWRRLTDRSDRVVKCTANTFWRYWMPLEIFPSFPSSTCWPLAVSDVHNLLLTNVHLHLSRSSFCCCRISHRTNEMFWLQCTWGSALMYRVAAVRRNVDTCVWTRQTDVHCIVADVYAHEKLVVQLKELHNVVRLAARIGILLQQKYFFCHDSGKLVKIPSNFSQMLKKRNINLWPRLHFYSLKSECKTFLFYKNNKMYSRFVQKLLSFFVISCKRILLKLNKIKM